MKLLVKVSTIILLISLIYLGVVYVRVRSKDSVNAPNTFIASSKNISDKESQSANSGDDYLQNANNIKKFDEFTEGTIDKNGFYIRVDKIDLFKAVVKNVDPRYEDIYRGSWNKGVSHGKFTATPDQIGITYLFSHAVSNESKALEQNAWFTYMDELRNGDEVIIYYEGKKYTYEVSEIHEVSPDATGFYTGVSPVPKIRMQFCGPPTGSLKMRTLVDALLVKKEEI